MFKRFFAAAGAVALLGGLGVLATTGVASAATANVLPGPITAVTQLTNRSDSGAGASGFWATDVLTRTAVLTDDGPDTTKPAGWETYTLTLTDAGSFTTNPGATDPNGNGDVIVNAPLTGSVNGGGTFTFEVDKTVPGGAYLPPTTLAGNNDPSYEWATLFFPPGTTIVYTSPDGQENVFSYTYYAGLTCETWVDASTDDDGYFTAAGAGGIQGDSQCKETLGAPASVTLYTGTAGGWTDTSSTTSSDTTQTWTFTDLPSFLSNTAGVVSGTAPAADAGQTYDTYVKVCDAIGDCANGRTRVNVVAGPPPTTSTTPPPTVTTTSSSSPSSSSSSSVTPSGGVETGGGLPQPSPLIPVGIAVLAVGGLGLIVTRRVLAARG